MEITIKRGAGLAGAVTASLLALLTAVPAQAAETTAASQARAGATTVASQAGSGATAAASRARTDDASLELPVPTGSQPVGTVSLHLVDRGRPDPWVPTEKARELMVSLWYPAAKGGGATAPYMTDAEAKALLEGQKITGVPSEAVSGTRTHAVSGARPAGRRGTLPLVVLSPGFTMSRTSLTALAEELASRGYVVAGIDHVHESYGTTLPGGRFARCVACKELEADPMTGGAKVVRGRQADVSFVLDRLLGRHPVWKGARLIDPSRVGMAGHS
ncbi:alpha/beta hydrolase family protein, partial [Nonomuraea pusilla]